MDILKQKLVRIYKRLPMPAWVAIGAVLSVTLSYALIFSIPKQVHFSYAAETCVPQFTLAPSGLQQVSESGYGIQVKDITSVKGVQLFGTSLCFTPTETPTPGNQRVVASLFGGWFASKQFAMSIPEPPVANTKNFIDSTMPTTRPLAIPLSSEDAIFDYTVTTDGKSAPCNSRDITLSCDIPALQLDQGTQYEVALERHFDNSRVATLASGTVTTLLPIKQTASSVAEGQVLYDKPAELTFTYDKTLLKANVQLKKQSGEAFDIVPATVSTKGDSFIVTPHTELPRKTQFELIIERVEATDGSALDGPVTVHFSTSGGPKVTNVSISPQGSAQSGTIIITLDQEVENVAKLAELVTIQGLAIQVSKQGNALRINYAGAPFCSPLTISIKQGLESMHRIVNDEDWTYHSRTICHTTRTIGLSTHGRPILAYTYGSGSKTILYTGSIHGNEHSSRLLMNAWMNELEANPGNIPAGTRIIVIPSVNPDGQVANSRYNSRTVDLNRNFNVSDWKQDVQTVNGQPLLGGGGSAPESEAETKALVNFSREVSPYLTLSYHSSAAYAIGNSCGNSASLATRYAQLSGYRNMTGNSGAFSYEITGTYDDWLCEKLGLQSVLIELSTSTNAEFGRNKAALWEMARS